MNNFQIRLAWTDFILDLQDLLLEKQVDVPLYIVGGAVRDAYLRGAIKDIDIAVDGNAISMARNVADWFNGDIFVMDNDRGVARVFVDTFDGQVVIDFAQFRGESLDADLQDRDFTVNAMAADLLGDITHLIDPLHGEQDLNAKVLQRCSEHSIQDDPIRILRAIRQSVQLKLKIHPDTLVDMRSHVTGLSKSSPERIRDEFFKVLDLYMPSRAIRVIQHIGALSYVIPDIDKLVGLEQPERHLSDVWNHTVTVVERMNAILMSISHKRTDNTAATFDLGMLVIQFDRYRAKLQAHLARTYGTGRTHQQLLILTALIHDLGKIQSSEDHINDSVKKSKYVADSLKLTNDEHRILRQTIQSYHDVLNRTEWSTLDLHRFWYPLQEKGIDVILLALADYLATQGRELEQRDWLEMVERTTILLDTYFNHYESVVSPQLYLDGNVVMELLNIDGGRVVGDLLHQLREAQVTGDVNSVSSARNFIEHQFKQQ
jgi:poly(A) polymerase